MSRRGRAAAFLLAALLAAIVAAAIADRYGASAVRGYGPLRPVVVVEGRIAAGQRIGPREASSALAVRRVPRRFAPPGALAAPQEALGLVARAALPPGSYLLGAQLGVARKGRAGSRPLGSGRHPVRCSPPARGRARRSTWWSPPNRAARAPAAPTWRRRPCRCSPCVRRRKGPNPARAPPRRSA
jgi:hypothetical protein